MIRKGSARKKRTNPRVTKGLEKKKASLAKQISTCIPELEAVSAGFFNEKGKVKHPAGIAEKDITALEYKIYQVNALTHYALSIEKRATRIQGLRLLKNDSKELFGFRRKMRNKRAGLARQHGGNESLGMVKQQYVKSKVLQFL